MFHRTPCRFPLRRNAAPASVLSPFGNCRKEAAIYVYTHTTSGRDRIGISSTCWHGCFWPPARRARRHAFAMAGRQESRTPNEPWILTARMYSTLPCYVRSDDGALYRVCTLAVSSCTLLPPTSAGLAASQSFFFSLSPGPAWWLVIAVKARPIKEQSVSTPNIPGPKVKTSQPVSTLGHRSMKSPRSIWVWVWCMDGWITDGSCGSPTSR